MSAMTHRLAAFWADGKRATVGRAYPSADAAEADRPALARQYPGWRWAVEPIIQAVGLPEPVPVQVWAFTDAGATMVPGDVRVIATVAGQGGGAIMLARSTRWHDTYNVWLTGPAGGGEASAHNCASWATAYQEGLLLLHTLVQHAVNAVQLAADVDSIFGVDAAEVDAPEVAGRDRAEADDWECPYCGTGPGFHAAGCPAVV